MASINRWKGNRWQVRYRTPEGKSRSQVFDRNVDAEQFVTKVEHSKLVGAFVDPVLGRTTVAEYWPTWLSSLRRGEVESWAAGRPVSRRTAGQAAQWLSSMLEAAVADGLIAVNPARGAKRPRVESEPVAPFTDAEVDALTAAAPRRFAVALTLGLGAGLRQSDATGLTVDRVDFLRRQLVVDRQLVTPLSGAPTFGPPKSARSYRTVPLADVMVAAVACHVEEHGTGEHGLLVCGEDGRPLRRQRFGDVWRQLRSRAELPAARFHDTRHTFASTLLSGGVSVAAAADYLGHSAAELLRTYAHLMPADHDRARSVVEAAFARDVACHGRVAGTDS